MYAGLSPEELAELRAGVKERMSWDDRLSDGGLRSLIEAELFGKERYRRLTAAERHEAVGRVFHSFRGLDALQPLLRDSSVTEIMINGHDDIYVERMGVIERAPIVFESRERLEDLIQHIVGGVNRIVNEASPIVDARLPDGSRVHVVLPPVSLNGPVVTIRRFPEKQLGLDELTALGALTAEAGGFLQKLVEAKYNLFISGGTGSGKTTLLNALASTIPEDERIVTIEDAAELRIAGVRNWVALETRNANSEGKGKIAIRELIRASLRMRPNRIIVGEVRGEEAVDMLQAMNSGHEGSMSTGHSNGIRDMVSRLESMVLSGKEWPLALARKQITSSIDVMIHLSRFRDGSRKVTEIGEVVGIGKDGEVELAPLFRFREEGESATGGSAVGGLIAVGRLRNGDRLRKGASDAGGFPGAVRQPRGRSRAEREGRRAE